MTALTEGHHTGGFILSEANGLRSRDEVTVTVPASATLQPGQVLGKVTATGKYEPYDNGATPAEDGTETAAGVLYGELINATEAPVDMTGVVVNADAEVKAADLIWGTGMDEDAGLADLLALGIKAR
jgi:hypothetical protein